MSGGDSAAAADTPAPVTPYVPAGLFGRLTGRGAAAEGLAKARAELMPRATWRGPMPWLVAIMVTLTIIAAAGALTLLQVAAHARADLAGGLTVQVLEPVPVARNAQARAVLAVLSRTPGVSAARLVPDSEVDALLSPWLGVGVGTAAEAEELGDAIPVPALIDAHLDGSVSPERIAAIRSAVLRAAPAARVDAQAGWLRPVFGAITALGWLALGLIVLLGVALASVVLLAVRTALGTHRGTIEVVHMLGGTDRQIAQIFERAIGRDALLGGVAGLLLGGLVVAVVAAQFADLGAGLVVGGGLGWGGWLALALVPLGGVALAMLTARISVLTALGRML